MDDLILTVTKKNGITRKGYVKTYTSNSVKIYKEDGAFTDYATLKILKEGKQLFSGGAGNTGAFLVRTLDEEDFDNCLPYFTKRDQKRLTFDLEIWQEGNLIASGEIDVATKPSRNYIIYEDGTDINIDNGILLAEVQ